MPQDPRSPLQILKDHAAKTLVSNKECLVAAFFRAHPNVDPLDVCLCSRMGVNGKVIFWVEVRRRKRPRVL